MTEMLVTDGETFETPERMARVMCHILEHAEYYEIVKPLLRFTTHYDHFQWQVGRDFDASHVSAINGHWRLLLPDGPYSEGGHTIHAYPESEELRGPRLAVQTQAPEKGIPVEEKQQTVEALEVVRND